MSTINTSYAAMQYGMNTAQKIRQQDSRKADTGEKVKETEETQSTETKKLSKKAPDCRQSPRHFAEDFSMKRG